VSSSPRESTAPPTVIAGPRIEREIVLQFQGDWGQANLHRICGWLAQEFNDRAGPGSRTATWSGRGGSDAVESVAARRVDLAMITPAYLGRSARNGVGMFGGSPHPELRALGVLPQDDRLVLAIGAELGIRSFADLRNIKPPLKIATSYDDGVNTIGYAVTRVLAAHGLPRDEILRWGGAFLEDERPFPPIAWYRDRAADAVIHEAIMSPEWQRATTERDTRFIPMEADALAALERELGWPSGTLPPNYLPGIDDELMTLDFSDFLVLVHEEMPDDVAYLLTWCMNETGEAIERQYRHIPADRSPVGYPLDSRKLQRTPIALHPGAEHYYAEHVSPEEATA
jgi:TRAP-type uncharacterized transport system substrate-binding protein